MRGILLALLSLVMLVAGCGGGNTKPTPAATQTIASSSPLSASALYAALRDTPVRQDELPAGFSLPAKITDTRDPHTVGSLMMQVTGPDGNDLFSYQVYADAGAAKKDFDTWRAGFAAEKPGQQYGDTRFIGMVAPEGFDRPAFCDSSEFFDAAHTYCIVRVDNVIVQGWNANTAYASEQVGHAEALARAAVKHLLALRDR